MIKLLLGGSPCTHWSIAQTKNRETEPSGIGWELFENYLLALEKFKPDFFLYENNKSMSKAIREEITRRFGFEPICINSALVSAQNRQRLYWCGKRNPDGTYSRVDVQQPADKGILLRGVLESGVVWKEKGYTLKANYKPGPANALDGGHYPAPMAAEPIRNWDAYCLRYERTEEAKRLRKAYESGEVKHGYHEFHELHPRLDGKTNTITTVQKDNMIIERSDGKTTPVYEVKDGFIIIKDKQYPIKLADGFYIIRKLTVTECKRLQTVPDNYTFPVSDTQAYKMLGNGWTVDVITRILSHCQGITDEPLDVLSMYDGMACGHIALDKMGVQIARYRATEIDKYAIKTACHNFPDIIQLGDAFQVREWK